MPNTETVIWQTWSSLSPKEQANIAQYTEVNYFKQRQVEKDLALYLAKRTLEKDPRESLKYAVKARLLHMIIERDRQRFNQIVVQEYNLDGVIHRIPLIDAHGTSDLMIHFEELDRQTYSINNANTK